MHLHDHPAAARSSRAPDQRTPSPNLSALPGHISRPRQEGLGIADFRPHGPEARIRALLEALLTLLPAGHDVGRAGQVAEEILIVAIVLSCIATSLVRAHMMLLRMTFPMAASSSDGLALLIPLTSMDDVRLCLS